MLPFWPDDSRSKHLDKFVADFKDSSSADFAMFKGHIEKLAGFVGKAGWALRDSSGRQ